MKVGIVTLFDPDSQNYGNFLQMFALNHLLNEIDGIYAETIYIDKYLSAKSLHLTYKNLILAKIYKEKKKAEAKNKQNGSKHSSKFSTFYKQHIKVSKVMHSVDDIIQNEYDLLIVGSDVVWTQNKFGVNSLRFLDMPIKHKISYAASFGRDYIPENNKRLIRKYLSDFDLVSVREYSSTIMLKKEGIKSFHVCDPTILFRESEWNLIAEKSKLMYDKYLFLYLLSENKKYIKDVLSFAEKAGLTVICLENLRESVLQNCSTVIVHECGIEDWLWLIKNAAYVISDSFHAVVFSSIFGTEFYALEREDDPDISNRVIDYLKTIHLEERFIKYLSSIQEQKSNLKKTRYEIYLKDFRDSSMSFLENCLEHVAKEVKNES